VKIRLGIGGSVSDPTQLRALGQAISTCGFDSIWLPEVLGQPAIDPAVGLSYLAGVHPTLKLGTTMLFTGVNPVSLAKKLASLDQVSSGRLLVTAVPGLTTGSEPSAIGMSPKVGGPVIEDALAVMRALWRGETLNHEGPSGTFVDVSLSPRPIQDPLEVWLAGMAERSLARCGRVGDGWLPTLCSPDQVARGREVIEAAAAGAGRVISDEHYGVSLGYFPTGYPDGLADRLATRLQGQALCDVIPRHYDEIAPLLERFIAIGFSKFVLRPLLPILDWEEELTLLGRAVLHVQR
jgi:probable F420-dependent oxidoreductase